jgi:hypothetical protein
VITRLLFTLTPPFKTEIREVERDIGILVPEVNGLKARGMRRMKRADSRFRGKKKNEPL